MPMNTDKAITALEECKRDSPPLLLSVLSPEQRTAFFRLWATLIHFLVHPIQPEAKPVISADYYEDALKSLSVESISALTKLVQENPLTEEFWCQGGTDDIDGLVLRFLRARKWNVKAAFSMLTECLRWRKEFGVRKLMMEGERLFSPIPLTSGESFFWKHDKQRRPVIIMRGKLHRPSAQSPKDMMSFSVYQMETGRKLLQPGVDKVCLLFDLSGGSLANFDLSSIRFIIQTLQDYYPECLGKCLLVNAPWFFWGCWRIIRPWLDPAVVEKVEFVSSRERMLELFDADKLLSWYGGDDKYEYAYIPPNEQDIPTALPDSEWTQLKLGAETEKTRFIDLTLQASLDPQNQDIDQQRNECKEKLLSFYRKIDKHSIAGSFYHRIGAVSREDGTVDWTKANTSNK